MQIKAKKMIQIEEVGNNRYRRVGTQDVMLAPNHATAEKRFRKKLSDELRQEFHVLDQMLFHKGYKLAQDQLKDMTKLWKELCDDS